MLIDRHLLKLANSLTVLLLFLCIGCRTEVVDETTESLDPKSISVQVMNKNGLVYPNIRLAAANELVNLISTADSDGYITFELSNGTYQLVSGGSVPSRHYVYAKDSNYEADLTVVRGQTSYTAVFREAVFVDTVAAHTSGTTPSITNEKQFAAAINLSNQTEFCSAGIGVFFGVDYIPPGTQISIYANNAGQPDSTALLNSNDLSHSELMLSSNNSATGGITGNFCDGSNTVRSLSAGVYWIVATFASAPNTCISDHCFNIIGTTSVGSAGLPIKVSADSGTTWTSQSFTAGGETRQSLVTFLIE